MPESSGRLAPRHHAAGDVVEGRGDVHVADGLPLGTDRAQRTAGLVKAVVIGQVEGVLADYRAQEGETRAAEGSEAAGYIGEGLSCVDESRCIALTGDCPQRDVSGRSVGIVVMQVSKAVLVHDGP